MDERAALRLLDADLPGAGDDAAIVDGLVVTTDMLHEATDFPAGTTRYTAGWRSVGASLSDVAAMGATATCAVAVYAAVELDETELSDFVQGARDVCEAVSAEYVGGDLDTHDEFTTASTAIGRTDDPVLRSGAQPGDLLCVTGELGRSAAAVRLFEAGEVERANDLFCFTPRVETGVALRDSATAMMDSSDGLARSVHQLAEASDCGFELDWDALPVHDVVSEVATDDADRRTLSTYFGEDFELVFTIPEDDLDTARAAASVQITVVGRATEGSDIIADGESVPDRGYTHGDD
ncbi:thiamine-phosphate kinase [Haloferax mediterranei ATCC 33500]|uniref:Thiamine-monophosphate kinase n=1 Tax=Haloferax mediterranei (strain ATCC 33500 / DSM 1411 / JCM 8866 / NBRC 14739 / NCIMB 2177 / R-4) TaxID=523841 RepID=I3R5X9_HALMT|nr:thiamine-phosphate kinase [Haloferax mediterranei]AFK19639.1 thiamine monophosphate kinase [Haloferax mediterranei ATCC 33500]AHZ23027.1 thiamine-monophosphate kinase [Haloferax mediterranei ATCC 33500]ELZ99956.1 thiamine-monophosphate kinase [Haloferax mediterranei ATCC 33500]MDX5987622.1 thiamine-phosphate kinase [Haloferax mediterranei ATCC 33500]QCQ74109.1 thiamine-phosphate kinase [Haloferax mediterranei ATCC 33500]